MYNMWSGCMMFGWIFWIFLIAIVVWVVSQYLNKGQNSANTESESAIDILKKRYVKGEITKEEFIKMKRDLL